MSVFQFLATH